MDSCHILLGCPWQYDLNAQHDRQKNNYTITKNGESFSLTPLPDEGVDKQVHCSVMVVGEKDFL